jgi:hypothetical protein
MNFGRSVPGERLRAPHHRNRVGPQQRNVLSHRTKPRSKLPPSARIMPLLYSDGILATQGSAGIELLHRIRKGQFALGSLRLKNQTVPALWNAVLAA